MEQIASKIKYKPPSKTVRYRLVNAYSHSPSKEQIITSILFMALIIIHEVFVTMHIPRVNQAILWTMFGFRYLLLLIITYDYLKLTLKDPVDRLIIDP